MYIEKRDKSLAEFDKEKIITAINNAFIEIDGILYEDDTAQDIAEEIENAIAQSSATVNVETIQDWIENYLMRSERRDVARAYIRYRYKKEVARNYTNDFVKAIKEKLNASNVQNQNANVDEASFGGRTGEAASYMTKRFALDYLVSDMARKNHEENMIYIHDLDAYMVGSHNCLSIPFDDLLAKGFNTRQTDIRPAGSINTAFQLIAVIFQLQSLQQFGGVSATHLDWTMVPYVRKSFYKHYKEIYDISMTSFVYGKSPESKVYSDLSDDLKKEIDDINAVCLKLIYLEKDNKIKDLSILNEEYYPQRNLQEKITYEMAWHATEKELYQAVEGMYHNLNTLQSRSGNQLPFTSVNYGTCTLPEGRMVIKALLEGSIKGVGKHHKTAIFPCGIFQLGKGINRKPGDPNYDLFQLALKSTSTRLYPNYANIDWSNNAGYDPDRPDTFFSTMGCRTANLMDVNGLGQQKDGRGNICPVTIILPTLAQMAKDLSNDKLSDKYSAVNLFMELLDKKIFEAKDMLLERFEHICAQDPASAKFMYENGLMAGYVPEEGIRSALKHGTLAVGQLGLAETLQILIGTDHTTEKGMELAQQIEQLFKDRCAQFKEEYKLNFGVYFTPAENLCYTALKKFRDKYGVIEKVSDKEYFTNSMHVPVYHNISAFDKIDLESQLTGYSSAGCITYVELDSSVKNNIPALEELVNYAMDKDIPYFAINVPCDTCLECGYTDEFNDNCPVCGSSNIQQLRRVTG